MDKPLMGANHAHRYFRCHPATSILIRTFEYRIGIIQPMGKGSMSIVADQNERRKLTLKCHSCGNSSYFIEIMAYESHLVTGNKTYIRLLGAEVARYECHECGE